MRKYDSDVVWIVLSITAMLIAIGVGDCMNSFGLALFTLAIECLAGVVVYVKNLI